MHDSMLEIDNAIMASDWEEKPDLVMALREHWAGLLQILPPPEFTGSMTVLAEVLSTEDMNAASADHLLSGDRSMPHSLFFPHTH